jgi:hypothetical protein
MWISAFLIVGLAGGVFALLAFQHWRDEQEQREVERYERGWRSFKPKP